MKTKIVLLSGKQGSGKSSIQKELARMWGVGLDHTAIILNFADVLYAMHDEVLKILHAYYPDRGLVKDGPLLQLLGTQWGRTTLGDDVWVRILKARVAQAEQEVTLGDQIEGSIEHHREPPRTELLVIVGDCRFENEFDAFPDALKVRLDASEKVRQLRCSTWRTNTTHASETDLDRYHRENRFDMYLDTGSLGIEDCANLILNRLCADALNPR